MDASALLTRQGWRGHGHALDHAGRGVKRPLLVSKKTDTFGVGKKKVDVHADQWWARAFDAGLKSLDVDQKAVSKATEGKANANGKGNSAADVVVKKKSIRVSELSLLANGGRKWLGLYDGFVRGEGLEGTLGRDVVEGVIVREGVLAREEKRKIRKKRRRHDEDAEVATPVEPDASAEPVKDILKKSKRSKKNRSRSPDEHIAKQSGEPKRKKKKRKHKDTDAVSG